MADWWNQGTAGGQVGFVKSCQLADAAVEAAKLASNAVETAKLADAAVVTAKLADANVTSEKLSTNALTRVVAIPLPDTAKGASLTCAYPLWRPLQPVTIKRIEVVSQTSWFAATSQTNEYWAFANASSTVGYLAIVASPAQGDRNDFGTITNATIAACVDLTLKRAVGSCSDPPAETVLIHYTSTG